MYQMRINNYENIALFVAETKIPVNVLLLKSIHDLQHLQTIGVASVSLGPNLLYHALAKMKNIAEGLQNYDTTKFFSQKLIPGEWLKKLLIKFP